MISGTCDITRDITVLFIWKRLWYQLLMILTLFDIILFVISWPITWHLGDVVALVGGATRQPLLLLRPRRRQRTGDGCWAERRRTWSNYLVIVCFTLRLTVTVTPPPWAWVRAARQTQTRSRCHRHGDWKQAYRDPHHHHGGRCAQAVSLHKCTSANNSIGRHCEENKINPI